MPAPSEYQTDYLILLFVIFVLPAWILLMVLMFKKPGLPSQFGSIPQGKWPTSAVLTVWRKSFHFHGRASRSEFWWYFVLGTFLVNLLITLILLINEQFAVGIGLFSMIPGIAVGTRRLHDIGRSGWWQVLTLTGLGVLIVLVLWMLPSPQEPGTEIAEVFE